MLLHLVCLTWKDGAELPATASSQKQPLPVRMEGACLFAASRDNYSMAKPFDGVAMPR